MIIRCWGARGSIPVSGEEYDFYGGDTPCMEVYTDNTRIVVDAGTGIKRLGKELLTEGKSTLSILMTHSHWDHIIGFPFFRVLYEEGWTINVHYWPKRQGNMEKLLAQTMAPPFFPIPFQEIKASIQFIEESEETIHIDDMQIDTMSLNHPNGGIGFKFTKEKKTFVFLTDNELRFQHRGGRKVEEYASFAEEVDLLVHDAEYTEEEYERTKGWGHSTFQDALDLAQKAQVKSLGFFHHNQDRTDEDLHSLVSSFKSRNNGFSVFALSQQSEVLL